MRKERFLKITVALERVTIIFQTGRKKLEWSVQLSRETHGKAEWFLLLTLKGFLKEVNNSGRVDGLWKRKKESMYRKRLRGSMDISGKVKYFLEK